MPFQLSGFYDLRSKDASLDPVGPNSQRGARRAVDPKPPQAPTLLSEAGTRFGAPIFVQLEAAFNFTGDLLYYWNFINF